MNVHREKALQYCNIKGKGLEIGPSFNPILPKREGYDIEILDHLNREALIQKYANDPNVPDNLEDIIEEVDYVWHGEPYTELISKDRFDYIISSHLIEHVPNLIEHLRDCSQLLKDGGEYFLIVPDKRYTFDYFRPLTSTKDVVDAFEFKRSNHSKGALIEYLTNVVMNRGRIAWNKNQETNEADFTLIHPMPFVKQLADAYNDAHMYHDIHAGVFTPTSFLLLLQDLYEFNYIDFLVTEIEASPTKFEFYALLKKADKGCGKTYDRIELLKKIQEEYIEAIQRVGSHSVQKCD